MKNMNNVNLKNPVPKNRHNICNIKPRPIL